MFSRLGITVTHFLQWLTVRSVPQAELHEFQVRICSEISQNYSAISKVKRLSPTLIIQYILSLLLMVLFIVEKKGWFFHHLEMCTDCDID